MAFTVLPLHQDIKLVISSPFLRCLQTAQQVAEALGLKGIVTCNALCELLTPGCNIVSTPEVPGDDIHKFNIRIDQLDSQPLPAYPETREQSEER